LNTSLLNQNLQLSLIFKGGLKECDSFNSEEGKGRKVKYSRYRPGVAQRAAGS